MFDSVKKPLNISSIAGLWNTYMNDSTAICLFKNFLNNVDDKETKDILQYALKLSEKHVKEIEEIFNKEKINIPDAFGEGDVDLNVPRLFTDVFYLFYLSSMAGFGMDAYSLMIRNTARTDIQDFFVKCLREATDLLLKVSILGQQKGIYINAPRIEVSSRTTYIEKGSFVKDILGEKRPLLAREVTNVFAGQLMDIFWRALSTGFGQVTTSTQVKDFMFKGRDIASAHFEKFYKILNDENIPFLSVSDEFVTSSNISPFQIS